ncbi:MAG: hypothetical protein WKF57_04880 [Nakamurella sp.]
MTTDLPRRRLSGTNPRDLASQAIWHAFPIVTGNEDHRTALLRWYGISRPAEDVDEFLTAAGYSRSWIGHLAARAAKLVREQLHPLDEQQTAALTAPIEPGEDIVARRRWSQLFGLPRPTMATAAFGKRQHAFIDLAVRCIAALGPLTGQQLTAAITEIRRRRRHQRDDPHDDLLDVLRRAPPLHWDPASDRYYLVEPTEPLFRDHETVQLLRTMLRIFSFKDYKTAMPALGFSAAYVVPYVVHVDRGRLTLVDQLSDTLRYRPLGRDSSY